VLKIDYSDDQVKVNSKNTKTNQMSEFNGNYCICTIPLGNIFTDRFKFIIYEDVIRVFKNKL
jgi:hypothetical protein